MVDFPASYVSLPEGNVSLKVDSLLGILEAIKLQGRDAATGTELKVDKNHGPFK